MQFKFEDNEFTIWSLLEYLQRAYGSQVSGQPFTSNNISSWIRLKKLPDAYGGNRVLKVERIKELDNLTVITFEHLNREDIESAYGSLSVFEETLNKQRPTPLAKKGRKVRTEFYYQQLGKRNRVKNKLTVPDNYELRGIKDSQFK